MSDTFFHLLGPGTQPDDDSFSMNPLPLTCQVNSDPSMASLENCPHSPAVMALLADVRQQLRRRIPAKQDVLGWDLSALNADDLTFLNTLLGEGEVSVRIQHADGRACEIQESIFCGIWRVRCQNDNGQWEEHLEAGSAPRALWLAATFNTLPDDSLLPPPVDGLMNGLTLAQELLAHVRDPALQPHSINLTQLPISDADRLFLARLCGEGHIQIRTIGYGESQIDATALRHVWHVRCLDAQRRRSHVFEYTARRRRSFSAHPAC